MRGLLRAFSDSISSRRIYLGMWGNEADIPRLGLDNRGCVVCESHTWYVEPIDTNQSRFDIGVLSNRSQN